MAKKTTPAKKRKTKNDSIIAEAKLRRLLQVIIWLKKGKWTVKLLSEKLDMKERMLYRYLKLLESIDMPVEVDDRRRYWLVDLENPDNKNNRFTMDELEVLQKLVKTGLGRNALKQSLQRKLNIHSELETMPDLFIRVRNSRFAEVISDAIKHRYQVILKDYHSSNSHRVQDRLIEPIGFANDFTTVIALDVKDKKCKQFKLERISEIVTLDTLFKYENLHEKSETDAFGWMGKEWRTVTLLMDMTAYVCLREEYPATIPCLTDLPKETGDFDEDDPFRYRFQGPVADFKGIGRFVLGLMPHVKIIGPPDFKNYVKHQLKSSNLL